MSRSHCSDVAGRSYIDKDQSSIPRITVVHWFRLALDSSGERPQLPTSEVLYQVNSRVDRCSYANVFFLLRIVSVVKSSFVIASLANC
ncbi:hypothetical protein Tco_0588469 [Tanacetum coccineum]